MDNFEQIILIRDENIELYSVVARYDKFTILQSISQNYFDGGSKVVSEEYITTHRLTPEKMNEIITKRKSKIKHFEVGQLVFVPNREFRYIWHNEYTYPKYSIGFYAGFDAFSNRVFIAKENGIFSYPEDTFDKILTSYELTNVIEKNIEKLENEIKEFDVIYEKFKDLDKTHFSYFPERIHRLVLEKNDLEKFMGSAHCTWKNEYAKQIACIDKGIRRLSKRMYPFTKDFPDYTIWELSRIYYSRKQKSQESMIKKLKEELSQYDSMYENLSKFKLEDFLAPVCFSI